MDYSRPYNIETQKPYVQTVKKFDAKKTEIPAALHNFLKNLKKASSHEQITDLLVENTQNELFENNYQAKNLFIQAVDYVSADMAEPMMKQINSMNIKAVPQLLYRIDNSPKDKVLIFELASDSALIPFNPKTATDRAKTEFYEDVKKLADAKCVDFENMSDSSKWFQNQDGTRIYTLETNIGGYLVNEKIESLKQIVFDKLFNKKDL